MIRRMVATVSTAALLLGASMAGASATKDTESLNLPGGQGKITSNAWRTTGNGSVSGNTRKWDYQVSAVYSGSKTVQRIRSTWWGGASLRNGASFSLGISGSGVTVSSGSTWTHITTKKKYWENTNGAKSSSWRSNMVIAPSKDYRSDTIYIANTALVKVKTDTRTFQISASA